MGRIINIYLQIDNNDVLYALTRKILMIGNFQIGWRYIENQEIFIQSNSMRAFEITPDGIFILFA